MGVGKWLPFLLFLVFSIGSLRGEDDTETKELHEVVVESTGGGRNLRLGSDGNLKVQLGSLQRGVRVMGEADILGVLKRTGGVSTVGDYGSGIVIQGNAAWQSLYRISRAPVFFPYRFGGVFSTFNNAHFGSAEITRYARTASIPSRLGALIDLTPALQYYRPIAVSANLGLLSSSLTAKVSAARRFALTASGRISYIDELYGRLLKSDHNTMAYRFRDLNISAGWRLDSLNTLTADFFANTDKIGAGNGNYAMQTDLGWRNRVASLHWAHAGNFPAEVTAYFSGVDSRLIVAFPQYSVNAPSGMLSYGLTANIRVLRGRGWIPALTIGGECSGYKISPLHASMSGILMRPESPVRRQSPVESRLYADASFRPLRFLDFDVGIAASCFGRFISVDPRAGIRLRHRGNTLTIAFGRFTQYLHNVGFSEIGLASNFWYASCDHLKPQHSLDLSVSWSKPLVDNELLLSAGAYYKRVTSQSEYSGTVLDVIDADYDASRHIFTANGYNVGAELGVQKTYGALTGAVSYSFGCAMRRAGGQTFRALTDAGHQLKVDAEYLFNDRWSVAAAFTYASGRVYTPTRYIYMVAGRVITDFAPRNSGRLPDYHRLDLSASYRFRTGAVTHMINLSLINAYGHRNVESQYFTFNPETLRYCLSRTYSLYRFLPSLSYSIDF